MDIIKEDIGDAMQDENERNNERGVEDPDVGRQNLIDAEYLGRDLSEHVVSCKSPGNPR